MAEVTSQGRGKKSHSGIKVEGEIAGRLLSDDVNEFVDQVSVGLKE